MKNVVIVGVGDLMEAVPEDLSTASAPLDMMEKAVRLALSDAGLEANTCSIDTLAVVRTFSDSGAQLQSPFGGPVNPPRALAKRLGIDPPKAVYSPVGGHVPQSFVNTISTDIALGEIDCALLVGAEALANQKAMRKAGAKADWNDTTDGPVDDAGFVFTDIIDISHFQNELTSIPACYALLENARRARLGLSKEAYAAECAKLFAPFTKVAAQHAASMFPHELSENDITTVNNDNPSITDLYPRSMVAKDGVNQGAAVLMMSEDKALSLGLDPDSFIYPHAGSSVSDVTIPNREDLTSSVAMKAAYEEALTLAAVSVSEIDSFDLYSCFPIAVFAACEILGLETNDPRGLTLTGGLPFFGGAGNNYSMHAIVSMVKNLRQRGNGKALIGANGGLLTKHAVGVYGTSAPDAGWREADPTRLNKRVTEQTSPTIALAANGEAQLETYCVDFNKKGPRRGYVIGRLGDGRRFVGMTDPDDPAVMQELLTSEPLGRPIYVTSKGPGNRFSFDRRSTMDLMAKAPTSLDDEFQYCYVTRKGPVLEITINRPEARNSLTPDANFELERVFDLYENDRSLWVAIITGAGDKAFSAGNDLKYTASGKPMWMPDTGFGGLTQRRNRSKPVIAAVNGFAFGGGFEIALACDIIVADETAKFALPEVKTGLIAAAGGVFRLPKALPPHLAKDLILTGRPMDMDEATRHGLVSHVAEQGRVMEKARSVAQAICSVSPTAVSASLQMMEDAADIVDPVDAIEQASESLLRVVSSEDLQIGLQAFIMKQKPKWKNR